MIVLGDKDISNLMLGNTQVTKVMLGEEQVYPSHPYIDNNNYEALVFIANAPSTIGLECLSTKQTLEYSLDGSQWNNFDTTTSINLDSGNKMYVRGKLIDDITYEDYTNFSITGDVRVDGDCRYIWDYENPNAPLKELCGAALFYFCEGITSVGNILTATTLSKECYTSMFNDCYNLLNTPELPATKLTSDCYSGMFYGCKNLTTAPKLPATILSDCCYKSMFGECTSLTEAPELPVTELANECYLFMFYKCTSLTKAPELPATILVDSCYMNMFRDCTNINYIKCLAEDISASNCTKDWVSGISSVVSTGTFVKSSNMNDWPKSVSGIPKDWTIINADE